jgi:chromosome segregation ATPase
MEEVTGAVGGFRAAIQDLLVPELKALQVEIRNVKETLERHEKWLERHDQALSQLTEELRRLSKDQAERFAAAQQETNARFVAAQQETNARFAALQQDSDKKFAAMNEKFIAVMDAIRDLQSSLSMIMVRTDFSEKIHQLELKISQLAKTSNPVPL